jgi:hypothetical protein
MREEARGVAQKVGRTAAELRRTPQGQVSVTDCGAGPEALEFVGRWEWNGRDAEGTPSEAKVAFQESSVSVGPRVAKLQRRSPLASLLRMAGQWQR